MNNELENIKNCFTENNGKMDLGINNLTANCISSKENNFNLDEEGNLTVNTITTVNQNIELDKMYPIGSIYFSINDINPSEYFSGVWEAWGTGRVVVGVNPNEIEFNSVEKVGGNKNLQQHNHTFIGSAMANHGHGSGTMSSARRGSGNDFANQAPGGFITMNNGSGTAWSTTLSTTSNSNAPRLITITPTPTSAGTPAGTISQTGSGNAQNLQPYITCYMWKRTA